MLRSPRFGQRRWCVTAHPTGQGRPLRLEHGSSSFVEQDEELMQWMCFPTRALRAFAAAWLSSRYVAVSAQVLGVYVWEVCWPSAHGRGAWFQEQLTLLGAQYLRLAKGEDVLGSVDRVVYAWWGMTLAERMLVHHYVDPNSAKSAGQG